MSDLLPGPDPIRREVALPRWPFGSPAAPIRPGPYEIDEADMQRQNEAWAERLRGRSDIPA